MNENLMEIVFLLFICGSFLGLPPTTIFDAIVRICLASIGVGYFQRKKHK